MPRSTVLVIGLLAWFAAGCRTSPPPPLATMVEIPRAEAPADPCLPDTWRPALELPAHADPSFDPDTGLRADVMHWGPVFPAADAPAILADDLELLVDGEFLPFTVAVLDAGEGPDDRRLVHVLCDEPPVRIGFWQVARELRRTNRSNALLVAQSRIPASIDDTTPGVRLPPGAAEIPRLGNQSAVRAVYDGYPFRADGWIDASLVDVVYESDPIRRKPYLVDGVVTTANVAETPGGFSFARFEPSGWLAPVRLLDTSGDHVLIRYTGDVTVVGWIDASAFAARPARIEEDWGKGGGGGTSYYAPHSTRLERGTLLVHEASETVLGVVVETTEFNCEGPCEEPAPRIEIIACEYVLGVRAIRPPTSERLCRTDPSR